jgi:hypothetical protein
LHNPGAFGTAHSFYIPLRRHWEQPCTLLPHLQNYLSLGGRHLHCQNLGHAHHVMVYWLLAVYRLAEWGELHIIVDDSHHGILNL